MYYMSYFPDPSNRPDETSRAYYPTRTDIKNHVYSAKRAQELSKLDQDNLSLKIEQWKGENPSTMFHYQPYKEIQQEHSDGTLVTADDQQVAFSQTLTLCPSRAVAAATIKEIWKYNCSHRCHLQNNEV